MPLYLLTEDSFKLLLEDASGSVLLERDSSLGSGILRAGDATLDGAGTTTGGAVVTETRISSLDLDPRTIEHKR